MQQQQMHTMMNFFTTPAMMGKGGGRGDQENRGRDLDGRKFREVGQFNGEEEKWREWSQKFKGVIKEIDPGLFAMLKWSGERQDEISIDDAKTEFEGMDAEGYATKIHNMLTHQH